MSDLVDKINPLNVLDSREVYDPPPYYTYVNVSLKFNILKSVKDWILLNLRHRFYIGETIDVSDNQLVVSIKIGFEEPKEASFFLIACPLLKYSQN
jgi:hypothetical protein